MSTSPTSARRLEAVQSSVFALLARRLEGYTGKRYPFHLGDNVVPPPEAARWENVVSDQLGSPYRYGHPHGHVDLREAIAEKVRTFNRQEGVGPEHVQVSVGATGGLTVAWSALFDPGDEVLLLAPYWPLIRGISHCTGVVPVDVPFYQKLLDEPDSDPGELIRPYLTKRTRAIYLITPNNPTGQVLTREQLEAIAAIAHEHNLWVISDEAYEAYVYEGVHQSIATFEGMSERTVSVYTFSKTYAMAGVRVGYLVGPEHAIDPIRRASTHMIYNTAQACQTMALQALQTGRDHVEQTRQRYKANALLVAEGLEARFVPAQGGAYVFVDLRAYGEDAMPVLERAADRGVTLAPGVIFGQGFEGYGRFCYTAVDEDTLREGIDIFNDVLLRG